MKYYNLTQGYENSSSHKGTYALDTAGKDGGQDAIYAPFTCKVTKIYKKKGKAYTVWLTSTNKVLCANGKEEYLTLMITHPEDIDKLHVGQIFKQGDIVCHEGATGNATGNHAHLELGIGKCGWHKNEDGIYTIDNPVKLEDYLMLPNDTVVLNDTYKGKKYAFKKENEISNHITPTYTIKYVTTNLNERNGAGTQYTIVNVLFKKTAVKVYEVLNGWARIETGMFVYDKYLSVRSPSNSIKSMEVTNCTSLNVRKSPNGTIVGTIPVNCVVSVLETNKDWIRIGTNKWVYKKYLK